MLRMKNRANGNSQDDMDMSSLGMGVPKGRSSRCLSPKAAEVSVRDSMLSASARQYRPTGCIFQRFCELANVLKYWIRGPKVKIWPALLKKMLPNR